MCFYDNNDNNSWIWIIVIIVLIFALCDNNIFGNNYGCNDRRGDRDDNC